MFYLLSKLFWLVAQPVSLIFILALLALVFNFTPWRKLGRTCLVAALLLLGISAFTNVGSLMLQPLENRFTRPAEAPAMVTGIIILGGAFDTKVSTGRHHYEMSNAGDRFVEGLRLSRAYPDAKILVSGGVGSLTLKGDGDAVISRQFFADFGLSPNRLLLEEKSRNTYENAVFSYAMAKPQAGEKWLLVTSAFHMPRAVGVFRSAGWDVVPWPTDYYTTGDEGLSINPEATGFNLNNFATALREWIGLVAYRITGKTSQFLP